MKFIDEVKLYAKAGDGGNGCVSWRREKFIPMGGPAGGDGGDGGNVILEADDGVHSLLDFYYQPRLLGQDGGNGRSKNCYGSKGNDVIARIPVGTQVFDVDTGECLADLTHHGMQAVICKGGSGGFGNTRFASSTRQAPDFANPGLPGDERNLRLSLKLMADVGLLGFPNAGKSTLLSRVSAAKPKIADYPFTTLIPQLGVVRAPEGKSFVMADIPGLIEGASEGIGLGVRFLKHLERVRVLCHLIEPLPYDFANEEGKLSLVQRYETIRKELAAFNPELCELPEIVVLSKMDLLSQVESEEEIQALEQTLAAQHVRLLRMSAATGEGIHELVTALWVIIAGAKKSEKDDKTLGFDPARG